MSYQVCRLIGGPKHGDVAALNVSAFLDGTIYTTRTSPARPDHVAVYRGNLPFFGEPPVLMFAGWQTKDLSGVGS